MTIEVCNSSSMIPSVAIRRHGIACKDKVMEARFVAIIA